MTSPDDQHFCPYCGFELDAYGGCRECDPDCELEDDTCLRLHTLDRRRPDSERDSSPLDDDTPERDPGGCLPVTPPLGLVAGTMKRGPG